MKNQITMMRIGLLSFAWLAAILQIIFGEHVIAFSNFAAVALGIFFILIIPTLKWDSLLIISMLAGLGWLLLDGELSQDLLFSSGRFILIFVALISTMTLAKATAATMPSVRRTQDNLAQLSPENSSSGLQIAGHVFGGIINTGTFAILSAALPKGSHEYRRKLAAEAALRGMVTSAVWSPFFVAFAVGERFVGTANAWLAMAFGLGTAFIFTFICSFWFSAEFSIHTIQKSLSCLRPIAWRVVIVLTSVLTFALVFNLTALSAVVTAMPILVFIQFLRYPQNIKTIMTSTRDGLALTSDDLIIISMAMVIGYIAINTNGLEQLGLVGPHSIYPGWLALIATPVVMMLASIIGIHPVISSTVMLAIFSNGGAAVHPALLMQSHLIGWGAGTMSSVASLSVITCARLYQVNSTKLASSHNLITAFLFAFMGGVVLTLINMLMYYPSFH